MVMEVHGSWPEGQGDGVAMPRGATGIDVYHITCTYELKRKVSHFAVDLHFDNLIVYIKAWSLEAHQPLENGRVFHTTFNGTAHPPRLVLTFHIGVISSRPTPSGTCFAPRLGDKPTQPTPQWFPSDFSSPSTTVHPCEMDFFRSEFHQGRSLDDDGGFGPSHPDFVNGRAPPKLHFAITTERTTTERVGLELRPQPRPLPNRNPFTRDIPGEVQEAQKSRRKRGLIGIRPMPRPMPGGLRDPTPSTTGRTTETTSSTTRTVQTPKPTQGSWEELCDKYFASKALTEYTTPTPTTWWTTWSISTTPTVTTIKPTEPAEIPKSFDYADALSKSILFYNAQRADPIVADRRTFDGNDLQGKGGWYDDGSAVKTTLVTTSSVTLLGWGYLVFEDGYQAAGQKEALKDCLRWPLDYLLNSWQVQNRRLIRKVGMETKTRAHWSRHEILNQDVYTIGDPHSRILNRGKDIAADAATALAIGSLIFKPEVYYSADLLGAAKELFDLAYGNLNGAFVDEDSAFYRVTHEANDEICTAALWLYKATGDTKYLEKAEEHMNIKMAYSLDYQDKQILCQILMHEVYGEQSDSKSYITEYLNYWTGDHGNIFRLMGVESTPDGLAWYSEEAPLRSAANTAFIALMAADMGLNSEKYRTWTLSQIQYMLGKNHKAFSYLIGFGDRYPLRPYHRASSCPDAMEPCDWNNYNDPSPNPHILVGALVAGPDLNDFHEDCRANYTMNRVAIDYNAGFQSALAGLLQYETPKITTRTTKTATGFKTTSVATTKTSTTKTPDGLTTTKPSKPTPQPTKLKSPTTTHLSTDKTTPKTEVPTTPNIFTTMTRVQTNASGNIPTVAPIPVNPGQPPSQVTTFSELGENISPRVCGSFRVLAVCSLIALCVCS